MADERDKEMADRLDKVVIEHKREIVKHLLDTDEPGKETW